MSGAEAPTRVSIAAGPLVGPVLRRVVGMFAARADLPLDRLDDAVLVADVVAARAPAHVAAETVDVDARLEHALARPLRRTAARRRRPRAGRRRRRAGRRQRDRAARGRASRSRPRASTSSCACGWPTPASIRNRCAGGWRPWRSSSGSRTVRSAEGARRLGAAARSTSSRRPVQAARDGADRAPASSTSIVDLTETTFVDSSSLGVLIGAHRRLKARGGRLVVACNSEAIVKTFRITGLDSVFAARRLRRGRARARAPKPRSLLAVDGGTGFPSADAQDDFSRARRSQLLAELGRRLRREPDDVALILPFDEVVEALGMVGEVRARAADDHARLDRRHGRPHARLRPRLPPHDAAGARPLAADRGRPAPRRVVPADLGLPDRRPALRARRPPPRLGRQVARARGHRRLRDPGAHADRDRRGAAARRPAAQGPRAAVQRARAAAAASCSPGCDRRTRGTTAGWPRASRPGASA